MAGEVRRDRSMKTYVCHPTGIGQISLSKVAGCLLWSAALLVSVVDRSRAVRKLRG